MEVYFIVSLYFLEEYRQHYRPDNKEIKPVAIAMHWQYCLVCIKHNTAVTLVC